MSSSEYYWSRKLVRGFGKMWFPIVAHNASSPGGGESLLGSVVKEIVSGWFSFLGIGEHYPMPYHMTKPRLIHDRLDAGRSELGIGSNENLILEAGVNAPGQTLRVEEKHKLKADVGPFPSLPVSAGLDIDYSRIKNATIQFGPDTKVQYIPRDYLARLHRSLDGDSDRIDPSVAIDIAENYIVDRILLAKSFTVTLESKSKFDAEFRAKLDAVNSLPDVQGKVSFSTDSDRRINANIDAGEYYLIALKVVDWDDLL